MTPKKYKIKYTEKIESDFSSVFEFLVHQIVDFIAKIDVNYKFV